MRKGAAPRPQWGLLLRKRRERPERGSEVAELGQPSLRRTTATDMPPRSAALSTPVPPVTSFTRHAVPVKQKQASPALNSSPVCPQQRSRGMSVKPSPCPPTCPPQVAGCPLRESERQACLGASVSWMREPKSTWAGSPRRHPRALDQPPVCLRTWPSPLCARLFTRRRTRGVG